MALIYPFYVDKPEVKIQKLPSQNEDYKIVSVPQTEKTVSKITKLYYYVVDR